MNTFLKHKISKKINLQGNCWFIPFNVENKTGPGFCSLISHMFPWFFHSHCSLFANTGKQVKSRRLFLHPVFHVHGFQTFFFPFSHASLPLCPRMACDRVSPSAETRRTRRLHSPDQGRVYFLSRSPVAWFRDWQRRLTKVWIDV